MVAQRLEALRLLDYQIALSTISIGEPEHVAIRNQDKWQKLAGYLALTGNY